MEKTQAKAWPKLHGAENIRLREQLCHFCQETSFTAIVNIYRASNAMKRIAWMLTFLFCLSWLSLQCYYLLDKYFSYPSEMQIDIVGVTELEFPSVTVCNMNPVRSNALNSPPFDALSEYKTENFNSRNWLYDAAKEHYKSSKGGPSSGNTQSPTDNKSPMYTPSPENNQPPTNQQATTLKSPNNDPHQSSSVPVTSQNSNPPSGYVHGTSETTVNPIASTNQTTAAGSNGDPGSPTSTGGTMSTKKQEQPSPTTRNSFDLTSVFSTIAQRITEEVVTHTSNTEDVSFEDFAKTSFNQWDVLTSGTTTGFYNTTDTEFEAAFKYAVLSSTITESQAITGGHQLKNFMISCNYAGYKCSPENFTTFHNHKYGNCFTFNHPSKGNAVKSKFAGPLYGLSLELYLEQGQYVSALSPEAGVKVVVHPYNSMPFPVDEGLSISPGSSTSIGLTAVEMIRLDPPHGECAVEGTIEDLYVKNLNTNYSKISCLKSCYQRLIIEQCNCSSPVYYVEDKSTVCNMSNSSIANCASNIKYSRSTDYKGCDVKCPLSCYEMTFSKSISMAAWPSNTYTDQLKSRVTTSSSDFMESYDLEKSDFAKVRVYFQDLMIHKIESKESYESMNLISDIGGQLGLWLGLSAITIGELFSCVLLLFRGVSKKMMPQRTAPVEKVKLDDVQ